MLYIDDNNDIQLTRGDTAYFDITIDDENADARYELSQGDELRFTVDWKAGNNKPLIEKIADEFGRIVINPEDTEKLAFRKYVYDVQLTTAKGEVYTIIPPSVFEVCEEVTI